MAAVAAAVTAADIKSQVISQIGMPIFNKFGKLAVDIASKIDMMIRDKLDHHHHVYPKEFFGKDIVIDELATDVTANRIRLTVLWSPDDKMAKFPPVENSGKSAKAAREGCMKCIEAAAKYLLK